MIILTVTGNKHCVEILKASGGILFVRDKHNRDALLRTYWMATNPVHKGNRDFSRNYSS